MKVQAKDVAAVYDTYPAPIRRKLLALRNLILSTAAKTADVGRIEECLKWGEPAYVETSGSGTTIRLAWSQKRPDQFGLYVNCQTSLIETYRRLFDDDFSFEGNRGIIFQKDDEPDGSKLAICIALALTYHRNPTAKNPVIKSKPRRAVVSTRKSR